MSNITGQAATGPLALTANGTFQTSTDVNLATLVGTRWSLGDGREVILVSTSSATTSTPGQLYQDPAVVSNHQNLTVTTITAYSNNGNIPASVNLTLGATALTANQYQGGLALINAGPGIGQTLRISENPAALASATNVLITFEDGPNVVLTTSSKVCLLPPHGANVIQAPTTVTNAMVGIALSPIPAGSYGFLQAQGLVAALSDSSAPVAGTPVTSSSITAGAIGVSTATNVTPVGVAVQAATSAEARGIYVSL